MTDEVKSRLPQVPMNTRDLVFIDCETSGLNPAEHEILEFAAMRMRPVLGFLGEVVALTHVDTLYVKTRMDHPERASPEALAVNGYSADKWEGAVGIEELLYAFTEFTAAQGGSPTDDAGLASAEALLIVGQNPRFDWEFLREAYRRAAEKDMIGQTQRLANEHLEAARIINPRPGPRVIHVKRDTGFALPQAKYTLDVASMAFPLCVTGQIESIRLEKLCEWYGVSNEGMHGALADVKRTIAVYAAIMGLPQPKFTEST